MHTLLETNLSTLSICKVNPGIYYQLHNETNVIMIVIGIDDLPLTKSSNSQFWPILTYIRPNNNCVFISGFYQSMEKPVDINDFLGDLIFESQYLVDNNINIYGKTVSVFIDTI